jgi:mRNA interferase MazF
MVQITSIRRNDILSLPIDKTDFLSNKELPLQSCIRLRKIFLLNESLIISKRIVLNNCFPDSVVDKIAALIKK